jgi:ABC-type cobalamin/Fe3+-siderophores transport system ATPase subunit
MPIEKVFVPGSELEDVKLKTIDMNRLGRFVALTGKNGAGKSRVLGKLNTFINLRNQYVGQHEDFRQNIINYKNAIEGQAPDNPKIASWKQQIEENQRVLSHATERIFPATAPILNVLYFVPKQLNLIDSRGHSKNALMNLFVQAKNLGLNGFETICFSYIQKTQDREWTASHQRATHDQAVIAEAKVEYERMVSLIELLLKAKLERSIDDDAMLFGKPLAEATLSDGQKVLIQLAVALHAQRDKLGNYIHKSL